MSSEQQYIDLFHAQRELICKGSSEPINAVRNEAMTHFERQGFPTLKDERWKYTNVSEAFAPDYGLNLRRLPQTVGSVRFHCEVPTLQTSTVQMVNDAVTTTLELSEGIYVGSLSQADPNLISKFYAKAADMEHNAVTALNTTLTQDGLLIYVPRGKRLSQPLQVINLLHSNVDLMVNRRILVILEEGAEATVLLCEHALDRKAFLTTQVTEIFCADNSHLDFYEIEETHTRCTRFADTTVKVERNCNVSLNSITIFNGLTRNTTDVHLNGENSEVQVNGCVVADKKQHVDNNTLIDHRVPHCTSRELYKYVLDEQSVGAFAGRILVRPQAQQTISQETNANLCVSPLARMYTQPMLEIYADDVQCNHGSTVGVLDESSIFYMQQRGIPIDEARMLLKFAFVGQVIDAVQLLPLRERLHWLVEQRFRGRLDHCQGCALCH